MGEKKEDDLEALELDLLLRAIEGRYGYDFRNYARVWLLRRIRRAVQKEGLTHISELQSRILHDTYCMQRFVTNVTAGSTGMFRDAEFYLAIRHQVIPLLRTYPFIRIWHVGCATGEEVYSTAILLEEDGIYDRCRIYATDLGVELIERARAGVYPLRKMHDYTAQYRHAGGTGDLSAYYTRERKDAVLRDALRRNIVFSQHDVASDGSFNEFNLILCRDLLGRFDTPLRDRVHKLLYDSLGMFGVLGLGMNETLRDTRYQDCYQPFDESVRLYRRVR